MFSRQVRKLRRQALKSLSPQRKRRRQGRIDEICRVLLYLRGNKVTKTRSAVVARFFEIHHHCPVYEVRERRRALIWSEERDVPSTFHREDKWFVICPPQSRGLLVPQDILGV